MFKFDFENIHRNKKWAFADGFLTASVIAIMIYLSNKDVDEPIFRFNRNNKKDDPNKTYHLSDYAEQR